MQEHLQVLQKVMRSALPEQLEKTAQLIDAALRRGNKILFCGNGGSAADSQHLAAEFVGRFQTERRGLPAVALTVDTSILTAVANDYGYDTVFARQVQALGQPGDVLVGLSTSGNSANVLRAIAEAKAKGMTCIGMTAFLTPLPQTELAVKSTLLPKQTARVLKSGSKRTFRSRT